MARKVAQLHTIAQEAKDPEDKDALEQVANMMEGLK
jgi:hypothetical protein